MERPDIVEIMALGHCAKMGRRWDMMTEQRREIARAEMRAIADALKEAGFAIVKRELILDQLTAEAQALGLYN